MVNAQVNRSNLLIQKRIGRLIHELENQLDHEVTCVAILW